MLPCATFMVAPFELGERRFHAPVDGQEGRRRAGQLRDAKRFLADHSYQRIAKIFDSASGSPSLLCQSLTALMNWSFSVSNPSYQATKPRSSRSGS